MIEKDGLNAGQSTTVVIFLMYYRANCENPNVYETGSF